MARYVAAVDQGTTSTRCTIFDQAGQMVSYDLREHQQIYPFPGWVEHSPEEIWQRTQEVIQGALDRGGLEAREIAVLGIANQRETVVVWDRSTGKPLYNAIVWQDTRTDQICSELMRQGGQDRFRARTGLPIASYFSGPKIRWMLNNVPGLLQAAENGDAIVGTIDSWLIWWLTGGPNGGVHVTDVTNASRTLMMNLETLDWDADILSTLGVPRQMLPQIRSSSEVYGTIASTALAGIPVAGALGDQQAALVGQACYNEGEAKNTYDTGCFVLLNTGGRPVLSSRGLLTTLAYKLGAQPAIYALEGSIAVTGALVQWLRDNLGLIKTSAEIEELAGSVHDNGGVYFVPAFSGLFAPYWDPGARGTIVGLTRYATRGHLARAALEAIAYRTRDVIEAMEQDAGIKLASLAADGGGMIYNQLLMQFQADIIGVPVMRPRAAETTSLGAAYAAGLATGCWSNLDELRQQRTVDTVWEPRMDRRTRQRLYEHWKRAVERSLRWIETTYATS